VLIPHRLGNCGTPEAELKFTQAGAGLYLNWDYDPKTEFTSG